MRNMRSLSVLVLLLIVSGGMIQGQNALNSPYSRFGLGDISQQGFIRNMAMGGVTIGMRDARTIDYVNPAAFSARDSMSFIFDFSLQGMSNRLKTDDLSAKSSDINFRHMAMAFPVTRWLGASIGIAPYSTMSYSTIEEETLPDIGLVQYNYQGSGGLSRFFLGTGISLKQRLSLGISLNYLFGNLERNTRIDFPEDAEAAETLMNYRLRAGGLYWSLGAQYTHPLGNDYTLTLGAMFEDATQVNSTVSRFNRYVLNPTPSSASIDTLLNESSREKISLPRNLGFGFSLGKKDHFTVGADYSMQQWPETVLPGVVDSLTHSQSFRFGMEYIPDAYSVSSYLATIRYRVGGYYNQSYLELRGEHINDFGISFGLGLPLPRTNTTFNVAFRLGQRGSLTNNLIRETYGALSFSLSLYDFWFIKYKFD